MFLDRKKAQSIKFCAWFAWTWLSRGSECLYSKKVRPLSSIYFRNRFCPAHLVITPTLSVVHGIIGDNQSVRVSFGHEMMRKTHTAGWDVMGRGWQCDLYRRWISTIPHSDDIIDVVAFQHYLVKQEVWYHIRCVMSSTQRYSTHGVCEYD